MLSQLAEARGGLKQTLGLDYRELNQLEERLRALPLLIATEN
jgi:hypothetical protein